MIKFRRNEKLLDLTDRETRELVVKK
jgi:hypothetical protein